jgi:hypothetical protein
MLFSLCQSVAQALNELIKYAQARAAEVAAQYDRSQKSYWFSIVTSV